jgi:hypothetical protein
MCKANLATQGTQARRFHAIHGKEHHVVPLIVEGLDQVVQGTRFAGTGFANDYQGALLGHAAQGLG